MASKVYDACVIGAGIEGSAIAYYLLKKGLNSVLLLEQVYRGSYGIATT